ncbi:MAG: GFA family protein [Candidatus Devosia phytovorans]|uniref:GFA family protein n=1 Tax=Candidatus Devosia phytovorans TaxID=3121372 RepID=A0AAJ5VR73_9HYPH|nr:GFA family protein [Devosia sp.]WEK03253.1 MAG: GFA family protein [Devosia sp.]
MESVSRIRQGGCLCGAVRYEVEGDPEISGLCHCTICRKLTGSVVSVTAHWRVEKFSMTGMLATYDKRQFCPSCGSRLFFMGSDMVEVFLGSLDDAPNGIMPQLEVWSIRREQWLPKIDTIPVHDHDPPPEALEER